MATTRGDVASHEVGHYFGLYHTWGRSGGGCADDDCVDDTENHRAQSSMCADDARCQDEDDVPVENLMNYASDDCRYLFTDEQFNRMDAAVVNFRPLLAEGLAAPVIVDEPTTWTAGTFDDRDVYLLAGASLTIPAGADVTLSGVDLYVAPQATLTVDGTLRLNEEPDDPVIARVRGLLTGSGAVLCDTGSEVIALDGGVLDGTGGLDIDMSCLGACLMARDGGTIHFGTGTHTFSNGALLVNDGGTMTFAPGADIVLEDLPGQSYDRFQATPGSVFRFGADAATVTVRSRTEITGTAAAAGRLRGRRPPPRPALGRPHD